MGFSSIGMSQLSTQYVFIPVSAVKSGVAYDPTNDPVVFAFMPQATQVPQNTDWVTGAWDVNQASVLYPFSAKCLVGPSGTITLGLGTYVIYLRVTDNPEIPVLLAGYLQIQ